MALPHLADDGVNGYLFEPNNVVDLTEKIRLVLDQPEEARKAMGDASHEMVQKHSLENTLKTFEDIYRGAAYEDLQV
jgi:1,2-diacylglycerol 3-alpha-glucosyltransferase